MVNTMTRREFLLRTSSASLALPFIHLTDFMRSVRMGIVVHSYAMRWQSKVQSEKYPGFKHAIDLLEHCHMIGAGGIQVQVRDWSNDFSKKVRDRRESLGMFLEGSIALPKADGDLERFSHDIIAAKEAGATIVRTVCLSGRRYENFRTLAEFKQFESDAMASLQKAEGIVRKHKIRLAVENHKDWRAPELAAIMKKLDSEWVGVNLDFGNNVALMEDAIDVARILAPYTMTTHVKDMGVKEHPEGFLLSEVPLGQGVLDLKQIFDICRQHKRDVHFNLEMITRDPLKIPCLENSFWATMPTTSASELASTLRLVRDHSFEGPLPSVTDLTDEQRLAAEEENVVESLSYSRASLEKN